MPSRSRRAGVRDHLKEQGTGGNVMHRPSVRLHGSSKSFIFGIIPMWPTGKPDGTSLFRDAPRSIRKQKIVIGSKDECRWE